MTGQENDFVRTITHKHVNMYLIGSNPYILFDCGWQDSFPTLKAALKEYGFNFSQIQGVFISHCHPDHAGTLELLHRHEVQTLIMERQKPYIAGLNKFFKEKKNDPGGNYVAFDESAAFPLSLDTARLFLSDLGINGKMVHTPGHSDDSYSLLIGEGAFIGDLPGYSVAEGYGETVAASWRKLLSDGARIIYPAHGVRYEIEPSLLLLH